MKKTIRLSIITLICVLMMFQPCVVNAQASVTDAEKIATQTDAQEQSYPEVQPSETEEIRVEQEMGQVSLTDIQTMDMGRYVIVGVDQPQRKNVSYRWQVYDFSTGSWTVVHEWTTATCVFWVPTHTGDYNLYVQAMSNGQVVSSYAKLHYFSGCVTTLKNISFQEGKGVCSYNVAYDTNGRHMTFQGVPGRQSETGHLKVPETGYHPMTEIIFSMYRPREGMEKSAVSCLCAMWTHHILHLLRRMQCPGM